MSPPEESPRRPSRPLRLAIGFVAVLALAACGGGDDDAAAPADPTESAPAAEPEPIVIETRVDIPTGKILDGSTIGGSPFCPGGTTEDKHGTPDVGLVERTITCEDGTLRVGFDPGKPVGDTQTGPWRIVSGTGAYEGWTGRGEMEVTYDAGEESAHPTLGRETFTGTVTR